MDIWHQLGWFVLKQTIRFRFPQVRHISTQQLANWLFDPGREKPILLDTRTSDEFAVSHLAGAIHIDPKTATFKRLGELALDSPIVAYCSVGYRSSAIAQRLQQAGYTNVMNLEGSIFQWANEDKPVYQNNRLVRQVHPYNSFWGRFLSENLRAFSHQS